jgi:hypothetical protein
MSGAINAMRSAGSSRSGGMAPGCPSAPDDLAMDDPLDQRDPAAQRRRQPVGLQVICQQRQQLLRGARVVPGQGGGVDLIRPEPAADHVCQQAARVELVVADDVGSHIAYLPPRTVSAPAIAAASASRGIQRNLRVRPAPDVARPQSAA